MPTQNTFEAGDEVDAVVRGGLLQRGRPRGRIGQLQEGTENDLLV